MQRFIGRVVFVTGGGHGIGRATCLRLAQEGASVAVADVDRVAAAQVADEAGKAGGSARAIGLNVTNAASVNEAISTAVEEFGRLDVLVSTAGGDSPEPPFTDAGDALWVRLADLNLLGVVRCIRAALPHLIASPVGGAVVTIGSVKAGLESVTKNLAAEYGRSGVRFNLIAPATIRTRVWDDQPGALDNLSRLYPLGRVGEPEDIAAAVAFLASDDAAWITGITLPVDGGILAGPKAHLRPPVAPE
jgi:meso-butanediol dehydrogenase/(S,S)-butanediol dehydrogenase/diacetyl reductase